jgi:hypothetical protein
MLPRSLAGKPAPDHAREDLAELINPKTGCFKRELTVSLRTSDTREGKRRDLREAARVGDLFKLAEKLIAQDPSAVASMREGLDLEELQATVMVELLGTDELEREEGDERRYMQSAEERSQSNLLTPIRHGDVRGMEEDHFIALGEDIEEGARLAQRAFARRRFEDFENTLRVHLLRKGMRADPSAPWYRDALTVVAQANLEAHALLKARQGGGDVPTPQSPHLKQRPQDLRGIRKVEGGKSSTGV